MCNIAADYFVVALKHIPNWFVTSKMIKKLFTASHIDEGILYVSEDSSNVAFFVMKWVFLIEILIILILVIILMNMIAIPLFISDFWNGIINLKKARHLKKS